MGNDNKVIRDGDLRVQSPEVRLFLKGNTLISGNERPATYNLEDEYKNSKKNKSSFTTVAMIVAILVVVAMTVLITQYIEYQNKQISVGIDVFEDLNLKKLLDVVTRTENALNAAIAEKSSLEREKQTALESLAAQRDTDLFLIESTSHRNSDKTASKLKIEEQYQIDCATVEQQYDALIASADTTIAEYQKQLSDLDGKNVAMAQEQKAAIDSQRQLFEIEKQKIIDDYEVQLEDLRAELHEVRNAAVSQQRSVVGEIADDYKKQLVALDPVIVNEQGQRILDDLAQNEPYSRFTDYEFDYDTLVPPFNDALENMRSTLDDFDKVWAVVASLPQTNTIPAYVKALKSLAYKSGMQLGEGAIKAGEEISRQYQEQIDILNNKIDSLNVKLEEETTQHAVTKEKLTATQAEVKAIKIATADLTAKIEVAKAKAEYLSQTVDELNKANDYFNTGTMTGISSGYILSATTSKKAKDAGVPDGAALIYVNPAYNDIIDGLKAYVYRSQNQLVAEVVCRAVDGFFYAECVDGSSSTELRAGDYLVPDLTTK